MDSLSEWSSGEENVLTEYTLGILRELKKWSKVEGSVTCSDEYRGPNLWILMRG